MRALVETGEQREAVAVYETMSELLFSNFGIMPSEESRAIHRDAVRIVNDHAVSLGMVREQLRESEQRTARCSVTTTFSASSTMRKPAPWPAAGMPYISA